MIRKLIEYQEKIIMDKHIHTPITEEITADLKAGDYVYITGTLYVARDAAHKRMMEVLDEGKELPIDIKNCTIYYMGPSPAREGRPIGSAGPTTASRMDKYAPRLLDLGEKAMIGKANVPKKSLMQSSATKQFTSLPSAAQAHCFPNVSKNQKLSATKTLEQRQSVRLKLRISRLS